MWQSWTTFVLTLLTSESTTSEGCGGQTAKDVALNGLLLPWHFCGVPPFLATSMTTSFALVALLFPVVSPHAGPPGVPTSLLMVIGSSQLRSFSMFYILKQNGS